MGINQLDVELEQLNQQMHDNLSQQVDMLEGLMDHRTTDERRESLAELNEEGEMVSRAIEENRSYYRRPSGRITGLFSRPLGPLPVRLKETKIDEAAEEVMASLPSYRFAAFGLLLGVITTLITLSSMFPWLMISPFSISMDVMSVGESGKTVTLAVIIAAMVLFVVVAALRSRDKTRRLIYAVAHDEEKWFRSGAESWTPWKRLVSCVAFGFCHVINIIYPLLTLAVLSLAGAAFMAAYLSEYRRSGDVYRATLAATKLHARYNIYAIWLVGALLMLLIAVIFLL